MYDIIELNAKKVPELKEIAKKLGVARAEKLLKQDLVYSILDEQALQPVSGSAPKGKSRTKDSAKSATPGDTNRKRPESNRSKGKKESGKAEEPKAQVDEIPADEKKGRKPWCWLVATTGSNITRVPAGCACSPQQ